MPVLFPKKKWKFYVVRFFFPWVYLHVLANHTRENVHAGISLAHERKKNNKFI